MASKNELSKEGKIKKEIARLKRVFKNMDKNKLTTVLSLIETVAFVSVSMRELETEINRNGYTSEYQNGENQYGTKKSPEVEIHIAMMKNFSIAVKQLADLVPPEKKKDSKLEALRKE